MSGRQDSATIPFGLKRMTYEPRERNTPSQVTNRRGGTEIGLTSVLGSEPNRALHEPETK